MYHAFSYLEKCVHSRNPKLKNCIEIVSRGIFLSGHVSELKLKIIYKILPQVCQVQLFLMFISMGINKNIHQAKIGPTIVTMPYNTPGAENYCRPKLVIFACFWPKRSIFQQNEVFLAFKWTCHQTEYEIPHKIG